MYAALKAMGGTEETARMVRQTVTDGGITAIWH